MFRAIIAALLFLATPALADTTIAPTQRSSISANGTITLGNTFQSALPSDLNRTGCIIQNTSTHTLYVYLGATASATTSNSIQVAPGAAFYCSAYGGVVALTDNIAVTTSTTSDTFVIFYQH